MLKAADGETNNAKPAAPTMAIAYAIGTRKHIKNKNRNMPATPIMGSLIPSHRSPNKL